MSGNLYQSPEPDFASGSKKGQDSVTLITGKKNTEDRKHTLMLLWKCLQFACVCLHTSSRFWFEDLEKKWMKVFSLPARELIHLWVTRIFLQNILWLPLHCLHSISNPQFPLASPFCSIVPYWNLHYSHWEQKRKTKRITREKQRRFVSLAGEWGWVLCPLPEPTLCSPVHMMLSFMHELHCMKGCLDNWWILFWDVPVRVFSGEIKIWVGRLHKKIHLHQLGFTYSTPLRTQKSSLRRVNTVGFILRLDSYLFLLLGI